MSSFRRRLMMAASAKPYDYELEWVQFKGGQYIDGGFYANENVGFEVTFEFDTVSSVEDVASASVFGARTAASQETFQISTHREGSLGLSDTLVSFIGLYDENKEYTVRLEGNRLYINGNVVCIGLSTTAFTTPHTVLICALWNNGSVVETFRGRLKHAVFFNRYSPSTIIADFIPVAKGGVGYLFDKVQDDFCTLVGTGTLGLGPRKTAAKPYDAEIDFISLDGNAWTTIPVKASEVTDRAHIEVRLKDWTVQQRFFSPEESVFQLYINGSGRVGVRRGGNWTTMSGNQATHFNFARTKLEVIHYTGVSGDTGWQSKYNYLQFSDTTTSSDAATTDLRIGKGGSEHPLLQANIHHFFLARNFVTTLVNLKPVRLNGVGYLYDEISGEMYGSLGSSPFGCGPDKHNYALDYLTFVVVASGTFSFSTNDVQYSVDGGAWTTLTAGSSTPTISAGSKVRWKATGITPDSTNGIGRFSSTAAFDIEGNIMSMAYGDDFVGQIEIQSSYQFKGLFQNASHLGSAEYMVLPAMILASYCYNGLFAGSGIVIPPREFPARSIPERAYWSVFDTCANLVEAPNIKATEFTGEGALRAMFTKCTSLVVGPLLRATTLANGCYARLFYNASSLLAVETLARNISANNCMGSWLSGVGSNGIVRKHRATTLPSGVSGLPTGWSTQDTTTT